MSNDDLHIATFDPGRKNCAFCVEKSSRRALNAIKPVPATSRYELDGTPTAEMENLLDQLYLNGEIVLHKNLNLMAECKTNGLEQQVFHNLTTELNKYVDVWDSCDYFLIETQMSFGSKLNLPALKIAQHLYSYFVVKYGMTKVICDFPAYHKTQILGAPKEAGKSYKSGKTRFKAMEKPKRKKWAVEQAVDILGMRGEEEWLESLTGRGKKDDLADCLLMCQAGKYLLGVERVVL